MPSDTPTFWAVWCKGVDPSCGAGPCSPDLVYLTEEEYDAQMRRPNSTWRCPQCGGDAWWDDDNYERQFANEDTDNGDA